MSRRPWRRGGGRYPMRGAKKSRDERNVPPEDQAAWTLYKSACYARGADPLAWEQVPAAVKNVFRQNAGAVD